MSRPSVGSSSGPVSNGSRTEVRQDEHPKTERVEITQLSQNAQIAQKTAKSDNDLLKKTLSLFCQRPLRVICGICVPQALRRQILSQAVKSRSRAALGMTG